MRFRIHNKALVSDIEKAFLQVGLQPHQRDVSRFLWVKDCQKPDLLSENVQEYRFCRVPFGVVSSPFLLGATINHHLDSYNTDISRRIKNDIYVDNLITGANTVDDAKRLYSEVKSMFDAASMNMRDWISNNDDVNKYIPDKHKSQSKILKVLGYNWNAGKDLISVNPSSVLKTDSTDVTKRHVLKQLASVYDPLGLFSPIILRGKMLLQTMWSKTYDWDDEIDKDCANIWATVKSDLQQISDCEIPRSVTTDGSKETSYSLQCFCDASKAAYANAVYIRQKNNCDFRSDLVFSKTRLAPTKGMSIPRMELMGVLIGVRCVNFVKNKLNLPIDEVCLSDSQCVLSWIATDKPLSVFVQNRVNEIKQQSNIKFGYIPSAENPADKASRGCSLQSLIASDLWWHGPVCLKQPNILPEITITPEFKPELRGEKQEVELGVLSPDQKQEADQYKPRSNGMFGLDSENFSSLTKLLRITAFVLRFVRKLQKRSTECGPLKSYEISEAEIAWLQQIQSNHFLEVFTSISKKKPHNLQRQLGLYVDGKGLLRCRGRLEHASMSEGSRRPILLPQKERFTELIIEKCHKQCLHSGVSQTLSNLRSNYWIPQGRATVRKVLGSCNVCRRHEGGSYKMPSMPPLPKSRVSESVPFSKIGLDYLGPLYIRSDSGLKKSWVCLFTCMVIRAVHLEIVPDATTEEFLVALRRFIATRGKPDEITSDNASQFKAGSKTINLVWNDVLKSTEVQDYVSREGIKWNFIVELAPWMGGFYERLVGIVKRAFRKTIGRKLLTLMQLQTLLKEIETVINSRPLVYVGDDINSTISLSPNHFLTLNPNTGILESDYDDRDTDYVPRENFSEKLLNI
ncbi:uncharacterized protein LOC123543362 [Mercenaria mercenaria]|uniref:uncharacterized protein LOC123543362 n=1 Tax=Mercenaria mercenaria TaxID=6596 RepID=UPI00234E6652|nr:uncharacterized protein LOC123543362 [Mercenaria mercenaria]